MGIVAIDMSMSLDGYIAAPNDVPGNGLGEEHRRGDHGPPDVRQLHPGVG
jgi:hypothetical protein